MRGRSCRLGDLYAALMRRACNSHRFLMARLLFRSSLQNRFEREHIMLDLLVLALGFVLFALTFGYAIACDRL
jgi:hypothetical protein